MLARPKFGLSDGQVHRICQALSDLLQPVFPRRSLAAIPADPADDARLLDLGAYRGVRIVRPGEFLAQLGETNA